MKNYGFVFLSLMVATGIFYCSCEDKRCEITGEAFDDYEGRQVVLSVVSYYFDEGRTLRGVDSVTIQNGRFVLCDSVGEMPYVRLLTVRGTRLRPFPVIVEDGKVRVVCDAEGLTSSGTPWNEFYAGTVVRAERELRVRRERLYEHRDGVGEGREPMTDAEANERSRELFKTLVISAAEDFIAKAKGTPVADYFFFQYLMDFYSRPFVDSIYPTINAELRERCEALWAARKAKQDYFNDSRRLTEEGMSFRELVAYTPEGKEVRLSDYAGKGKVVLIDFWASWCGPCIHEMPFMRELYQKYRERGLVFLGVSLDSDREKWLEALETHQAPGIQVSNLMGWEDSSPMDYGVQAIPFTILIDQTGKIVARNKHQQGLEECIKECFR